MLINLKQCFWNVICPPPGRYVFSPRQLQIMMTFTGNNDVMRWRVPLCDAGVEDADTMFLQVRGCGCPGSAQLVQSQLPPHRFHSDEIVEMVICKRSGHHSHSQSGPLLTVIVTTLIGATRWDSVKVPSKMVKIWKCWQFWSRWWKMRRIMTTMARHRSELARENAGNIILSCRCEENNICRFSELFKFIKEPAILIGIDIYECGAKVILPKWPWNEDWPFPQCQKMFRKKSPSSSSLLLSSWLPLSCHSDLPKGKWKASTARIGTFSRESFILKFSLNLKLTFTLRVKKCLNLYI